MQKIEYKDLNSRQQENYNFHKIAADLAEYGYSCMWLNDDWQGADFIANHIDGDTFLKVQLKGRLTVNRKYLGKNIHVAFRYQNESYFYPHDEVLQLLLPRIKSTNSWSKRDGYAWGSLSENLKAALRAYKI